MEISTWTEGRVADLKRLWADGYSSGVIAEKLGVTRNAIIGKIHRMDLPTPLMPKTHLGIPGRTREVVQRLPKAQKAPKATHHTVRLVRATHTSNSMKILRSLATDPYQVRCVEIEPQHVTLVDLTGCKYPYGDGPFTFCNHPLLAGSSYCAPHHQLCLERPRAPILRFAGVAA